ncbi:MAG: hypothetical protein ABSG69_06070 [Candidatus Acidiferrum sp.]|jgi:hypothetical protein
MTKVLLGILLIIQGIFILGRPPLEQGVPIPPGRRTADQQSNAPLDPPVVFKQQKVDPKKLKDEAEELAKLSSAVPPQVEQVRQGQVPKDLSDQLKHIEKLAKHLRGEIFP